jgi:hypothetical protein
MKSPRLLHSNQLYKIHIFADEVGGIVMILRQMMLYLAYLGIASKEFSVLSASLGRRVEVPASEQLDLCNSAI